MNIQTDSTSPLHALRLLGFGLGLGWMIFVIISYFSVDRGFVFNYLNHMSELKFLFKAVLEGMFLVGSGTLLGYAACQPLRWQTTIGALSVIVACVTAWVMWPVIQANWLILNHLPDRSRVTLLIWGASFVGAGMGFGARVSQRSMSMSFLVFCLLTPFLFITLRAGAITSLLALVWLFFLADAIGTLVLKWLNHFAGSASASIKRVGLLSIAVGLAILILGMLALGLAGGSSRTGILLTLFLFTIFCLPQIKISLARLANFSWSQPVAISEFELGALFMLAALFNIFWIGALAPEVGADALGLRVAGPAIWLREGHITPLPEILGSYGYFAGEMISLLVMPMTGLTATKVVQFGLAGLLAASAYLQVFESRYRKGLALILFAFWGSTVVWWQMVWGFVDLSQVFFYFACILALRFWLDEPDNPIWLVVAGIVGATATTIKLNGAGALVIATLVVASITLYRSRSLAKTIRNLLYLAIPALIFLLPWLARSYILTKNPLFPRANQIFESPLLHKISYVNHGVGLTFPDVLTVPWGLFFDVSKFGLAGATFHPLILACALLGVIGLVWAKPKDWLWFVAGVLAFLSWLVTMQNSRYGLYVIYLLTLAFGIGLLKWQDSLPNRFQRTIFHLLILIGLALGFGIQVHRPIFWLGKNVSGPLFPTQVVFGAQSKYNYLTRYVKTYSCAEWFNRKYGKNAKVWLGRHLRDHLYFNAPTHSQPHGILSITQPLNEILKRPLNGDHSAIYQRLLAEGYTHLAYKTTLSPWTRGTVESKRQGIFSPVFGSTYLQLEFADRGLRLYKIRHTPLSTTTPLSSGPDLLSNGGFEMLNPNGRPIGWNLRGQGRTLKIAGNEVFELRDATLTQSVDIKEDQLYKLALDYKTSNPVHKAYIQMELFDSSGKRLLLGRESILPASNFTTFNFFQTAPPGSRTAVIHIHGNGITVDNICFSEN